MLSKLYSWYGKKAVWAAAALVVALILAGVALKLGQSEIETIEAVLPSVTVASVASLSGQESVVLLGTVRAVSEAEIQSESGGRVTAVSVTLGQTIGAGQVIATLENASQRASVLQAEGAYEAALANASVGDVSVSQAETSLNAAENAALSSMQGAYTTVSNGFFTLIDEMYNNVNSPLPTLYISNNNGSYLRSERVAFQTILSEWQAEVVGLDANDDLQSLIEDNIEDTVRTRALVDAFIAALQDRSTDTLNGIPVTTLIQSFSALRVSLDANISALENAGTALSSAEDNLTKAKIGGTQTDVSAANAQVKQALGSLRAAQANLNKTIMRSPIAGTVNELNVNIGDFVGAFTPVAKVANNKALEISIFVGESDLEQINVGDKVTIEGEYEGIVTNIGAGIDSATQKTEVKIGTEATELTNGNTVTVTLQNGDSSVSEDKKTIVLPISAIKFTAEAGSVFTIENGVLTEHQIEIGSVRGGFVEVVGGVTLDMKIVVDARGLTAGAKVEATE